MGSFVKATALSVLLFPTTGAWAGMHAPVAVRADAVGHFEYDWFFVFEQSFLMAGFGASNVNNTSQVTHGDCFCLTPNCNATAGDTLSWHVSGKLANLNYDGRVRNWVAGCESGEGGSTNTEILSPLTTGVDDDAPGEFQLRSEPNPCVQRATLHFDLPAPGRVTLCLYDVNGRRVAMLLDGSRSSGRHEVTWRVADSDVPRGVYFARLQFGGRVATQRLLVLY